MSKTTPNEILRSASFGTQKGSAGSPDASPDVGAVTGVTVNPTETSVEDRQYLTQARGPQQMATSQEARESRRRFRLGGALGATAVLAATKYRAVKERLRPQEQERAVSQPPVGQHRRQSKHRAEASLEQKRERATHRRIAGGVAAALGLTAVLIGFGAQQVDEGGHQPLPVATPSRTPSPSTAAPSHTGSATPAPTNGPQQHLHHHPQTSVAHHPAASDVRAGEYPWDTLSRLGVPSDQIMRDISSAAEISHHAYSWHGHGEHRWIEVDGRSGTRHVIAVLGPYINLG